MIGKLKGIAEIISKDQIIIDVNGVGYLVSCSGQTIGKLHDIKTVSLLIDTIVREDNISLYGFFDHHEQEWFRYLVTVKGVGAKLALTILSNLTPDMLINVIYAKDTNAFKDISGVGKKLAERIVIELKDKVSNFSSTNSNMNIIINDNDIQNDAISALVNLGYNRSDVYKVVIKIMTSNKDIAIGDLIRKSLQEL